MLGLKSIRVSKIILAIAMSYNKSPIPLDHYFIIYFHVLHRRHWVCMCKTFIFHHVWKGKTVNSNKPLSLIYAIYLKVYAKVYVPNTAWALHEKDSDGFHWYSDLYWDIWISWFLFGIMQMVSIMTSIYFLQHLISHDGILCINISTLTMTLKFVIYLKFIDLIKISN